MNNRKTKTKTNKSTLIQLKTAVTPLVPDGLKKN